MVLPLAGRNRFFHFSLRDLLALMAVTAVYSATFHNFFKLDYRGRKLFFGAQVLLVLILISFFTILHGVSLRHRFNCVKSWQLFVPMNIPWRLHFAIPLSAFGASLIFGGADIYLDASLRTVLAVFTGWLIPLLFCSDVAITPVGIVSSYLGIVPWNKVKSCRDTNTGLLKLTLTPNTLFSTPITTFTIPRELENETLELFAEIGVLQGEENR